MALAFEHLLHSRYEIGQVVRVGYCGVSDVNQLLVRISKNVRQRAIDLYPSAVRIHQGHADWRVAECAPEPFLALLQLGEVPLGQLCLSCRSFDILEIGQVGKINYGDYWHHSYKGVKPYCVNQFGYHTGRRCAREVTD